MSSKHVVWTPSLHPRDLRGRFDVKQAARQAKRDSRSAVDTKALRERRKMQRRASLRLARGLAVGGASIAAGHYGGSRAHVAGGAARVGVALAEGQHNFKSAKRVTSKDFAKLSEAQQRAELSKRRRRSGQFAVAGGAGDIALGIATTRLVRSKTSAHKATRLKDANFTYMKGRAEQKVAATRANARFYQFKKKRAKIDTFSKYQGPLPSSAKSAAKKGASAGVYNISSGRVSAPRSGVNAKKASAARRAASSAAGKVGTRVAKSNFVQRKAADQAVKVALRAQAATREAREAKAAGDMFKKKNKKKR